MAEEVHGEECAYAASEGCEEQKGGLGGAAAWATRMLRLPLVVAEGDEGQ